MDAGIQTKMIKYAEAAKHINATGCYFLCLLHYFHVDEDQIIKLYFIFNQRGWLDKECTVLNPAAICNYLSGEKWTVYKDNTKPKTCTFYIEYWFNPRTGYHHFKLPNWDSLDNSVTVKEGFIEAYRVYKKL